MFRSSKLTAKNITLEHFHFLKKLKNLDLTPIADQLMNPAQGNGWTKEKTTQALLRYMMFLCLIYLYPQQKIVPTVEIDRVWHHHILDTSKYAADCEMLFGRFIHHFPYFGQRGESDRQQWQTAFSQSQMLFQQHFDIDILSQNDNEPPARCEPLIQGQEQASDRPTIDIELAISWDEAIAVDDNLT